MLHVESFQCSCDQLILYNMWSTSHTNVKDDSNGMPWILVWANIFGLNIFYSEEMDWAWHTTRQCPLQKSNIYQQISLHITPSIKQYRCHKDISRAKLHHAYSKQSQHSFVHKGITSPEAFCSHPLILNTSGVQYQCQKWLYRSCTASGVG